MAYVPFAPQLGAVYSLTNPINGVTAVFNDPTSPNYVGMLTGIDGLDSPEVRESAEDLVQADGGTHGHFYYSRRAVVLSCSVFGHSTVAAREIRVDRARQASNALRADATLAWTNVTGTQMFLPVRLNGRFQHSGGWVKELSIPLVSEYATIQSSTLNSVSSTAETLGACENKGSWPASPIIQVTGPTEMNPWIASYPPGGSYYTYTYINTSGSLLIASGETIEFDCLNHNAYFIAGARNGQSANRFVNWGNTEWPRIVPGVNNIELSGTTGTVVTKWRDTWV